MNKLLAFLRQIHNALYKSKRNHHIIKDCENFLLEGTYMNTVTFDCVYNTCYHPHFNTSTFTAHQNYLFYLSKLIIKVYNYFFPYKVLHKNKHGLFEGTEIILSSSMSEYKIFNFPHRLVLSTFKSRTKLIKIIKAKQLFANTFNIPNTMEVNLDCLYMIEEFIPHSKYNLESLFNQLCDFFCKHLTYHSSQIIRNSAFYINACEYFEKRFGKSNLINEETGGVLVYLHGDLWSSNIIYNDGKIFVTDFEHAGIRFFLFDFFMFIFTEWHLKNDRRLVINYLNGIYDFQLKRMFNIVGLSFDYNRRTNYFMVFIISILYERWRGFEAIEKTIISFINTFLITYKNDNKV